MTLAHKLYIVHKDKIYLINYFNDNYLFSMLESGRTLVLRWNHVENGVITPAIKIGIGGTKAILPTLEMRDAIGATAEMQVVPNKFIKILSE